MSKSATDIESLRGGLRIVADYVRDRMGQAYLDKNPAAVSQVALTMVESLPKATVQKLLAVADKRRNAAKRRNPRGNLIFVK